MKKIITIVGPTAVGKSRLALYLAPKHNGEIINADSRQVYRYMDIGTAKPSKEEQSRVPHHLLDIVNPDEHFSLGIYQEKALDKIHNIQNRGKIPILVGGTGLYIKAIIESWKIPHVPPDENLRASFEKRAEKEGINSLYEELRILNPEAAGKISQNNLRRIIRALEIFRNIKASVDGVPYKKGESLKSLIIGLTMPRDHLNKEINNRVDEMLRRGVIEEVKNLLSMGYNMELPSMSGIGYRQIGRYLKSEITLQEAILQIKQRTRRFASRQYAWFSLNDKQIHWFDVQSDIKDNIDKLIRQYLTDNS